MKHHRVREGAHVVIAVPAKIQATKTHKARVHVIRPDGTIEWAIWLGEGKKKAGTPA